MGKGYLKLKIRYHKRGMVLEKGCVMNKRELRHEYERFAL